MSVISVVMNVEQFESKVQKRTMSCVISVTKVEKVSQHSRKTLYSQMDFSFYVQLKLNPCYCKKELTKDGVFVCREYESFSLQITALQYNLVLICKYLMV